MAFVPQLFITIGANMRIPLIITFNAVFLFQSISAKLLTRSKETNRTKEHFNKDLGPLHIQVNTTKLPPEYHPTRWDDRHATQKTATLVDFIKALPKLNPFKGQRVHFDKANLTFENVIVTGLKELFVQNINMQLAPARIDFNASIPSITIEADFDLDTIFGNYLPIRDSGHIETTLLNLVVSAVIGPKSEEFQTGKVYQLETAVIAVDLRDVQLQMDTKYAKEVKLILDEFFKNFEDLIVDNDVLNMMLKAINQELAKIPAKKIVHYLLGTSEPNLTQFGLDS